jgi:hypothetical protein
MILLTIAVLSLLTFIVTDIVMYPPGYRVKNKRRFTRSHWN